MGDSIMMITLCFQGIVCFSILWGSASGHGRLWYPVGRATMWRTGKYATPKDYNDHQLYCGGLMHQTRMGGKCGICGDPYDQRPPRAHEIGGRRYVKQAIIVERYKPGSIINAKVQLTVNHLGFFEFRVCPVTGMTSEATQECLNRRLLKVAGSGSTSYPITARMKMVIVPLQLPPDLTCDHCVFQWMYTAGNNWSPCPPSLTGARGCGRQEQFYGCADIAIG